MRGYYHITTTRTGKLRGNTRNITIYKYIFDGLSETKFESIDFTNIRLGSRIAHSLKTCAVKEVLMLEFPASWYSISVIADTFEKNIDAKMIWSRWDYISLNKIQNAIELPSDEEFISIFQKILESLPKRTVSQKNKIKMLDQISANLL